MPQDWYVLAPSGPEGPLRFWLLLRRVSMAPDTLVRKGTVGAWKRADEYAELRPFLRRRNRKKPDDPKSEPKSDEPKSAEPKPVEPELIEHLPLVGEVIATYGAPLPPGPWWIWLLILLLLALTSNLGFRIRT